MGRVRLSVGLGDTLELVLLLDGVAVAGSLGSVDELVTEALSDTLDVTEGCLTGASAQQPDGLVDPPEWRHIDSLPPDSTSTTNTGGVLTGPRVNDGIHQNLEGVLASEKMNDLKAVLDNPDCHQLLAVVPAMHHQAVHKTLDNGALSLGNLLAAYLPA